MRDRILRLKYTSQPLLGPYEKPEIFVNHLNTARLANGIYDKLYHKLLKSCKNRSRIRIISLIAFGISGITQNINVIKRLERYIIVVHRRFSWNIFLNCRFGPQRNVEDNKARMFPVEYIVTKWRGWPSHNSIKNPNAPSVTT